MFSQNNHTFHTVDASMTMQFNPFNNIYFPNKQWGQLATSSHNISNTGLPLNPYLILKANLVDSDEASYITCIMSQVIWVNTFSPLVFEITVRKYCLTERFFFFAYANFCLLFWHSE